MKRILAAALSVVVVAAACGPGAPPRRPASSGARHRSCRRPPRAAASPSAAAPLGTVRLALDWTPNTNHTGFYVAAANGWYDEAGVDLQILPYASTTPEALIAAGQAECGISFQDALTFAAAAGAPIVSVMAILQHTAQEIAVLASSDIDAAEGPRRPHLRRLRLPERGADAQGGDRGRRRDWARSRRSPSTPPRTRRSTPSAPTS